MPTFFSKDKLRDLVIEVTGLERENQIVAAIVSTIQALKAVGEVDEKTTLGAGATGNGAEFSAPVPFERPDLGTQRNGQEVGINLSYMINLNLPTSTDPGSSTRSSKPYESICWGADVNIGDQIKLFGLERDPSG